MCGITGSFRTTPIPDAPALLLRQLDVLSHRGPDGCGRLVVGPSGSFLHRQAFSPDGGRRDVPAPVAAPPSTRGVQISLGIRRLAFVDVHGGHAPAFSEDGNVAVVLNGQIYNYRELQTDLEASGHRLASRSDTEVLAHLYEELGIEGLLQRIRGMFAIALWDARTEQLFLARDPMGIKPLHVARQVDPGGGETLWFASEIKAILVDPAFDRRMDPAGLVRYLAFEQVPAPRTMFQDLTKVEPGHYLQIQATDGRRLEVRRRSFWRLPDKVADRMADLPSATDTTAWKARITDTLTGAVRRRVPAEVPVAGLLSGGIDSGIVSAILAREVPGRLRTFSVGFEDADFDESGAAQRVAAHLGVDHQIVRLEEGRWEGLVDAIGAHQDEPLGDHSLVPSWLLAQTVRAAGFPGALSGDGGDELFAGYPTYVARRLDPVLDAMPVPLVHLGLRVLDTLPASGGNFGLDVKARMVLEGALEKDHPRRQARWMGAMGARELERLLDDETRGRIVASGAADPWAEVDQWAWVHRRRGSLDAAQVQDIRFYLQDDVLLKVDRASMASAVEVRVPMLDLEVVALALALPWPMRIRLTTPKWMLRQIAADLLPADIVNAPKRGFGMPTSRWLRRLGEAKLLDWLRPPAGAPPLVVQAEVERRVREHVAGRRDHRRALWTLLMLRRWQASPWAAT